MYASNQSLDQDPESVIHRWRAETMKGARSKILSDVEIDVRRQLSHTASPCKLTHGSCTVCLLFSSDAVLGQEMYSTRQSSTVLVTVVLAHVPPASECYEPWNRITGFKLTRSIYPGPWPSLM